MQEITKPIKGRGYFYEHAPTHLQFKGTPNERHLRMLQFIHLHGCVTANIIWERERTEDGMSYDAFKDSIKRLWRMRESVGTKRGYLYRPRQQRATEDANYNEYIYDLTPEGRELLKEHGLYFEPIRPTGHWVHQLFVSCYSASIHVMCERYGYRYIPPHEYLNGKSPRVPKVPFTWEDKEYSYPLEPDLIYAIDYGGQSYIAHFVEIDRGTVPLTKKHAKKKSAQRMILQYASLIGKKLYREAYEREAMAVMHFITTSETRANTYIGHVTELVGSCPYLVAGYIDRMDTPFKPPKLMAHLFEQPLLRAKTKTVMKKFRNKKTGEVVERPKEVMDTWTVAKLD